jgi:hypothetical protein
VKRKLLEVDDTDQKANCLYFKVYFLGERMEVVERIAKRANDLARGNCVWIITENSINQQRITNVNYVEHSGINSALNQDDKFTINCYHNVNRSFQKSVSDSGKFVEDIIQVVKKMGWPTK